MVTVDPLVGAMLVVGLGLATLPLLAVVSSGVAALLSRLALRTFGEVVESKAARERRLGGDQTSRVSALRGAHVAQTYRVYAARTLLYATLVGLGGSILGVLAAKAVFDLLGVPTATLQSYLPALFDGLATGLTQPSLSPLEAFGLFLVSSLTLGVVAAATVYQARWWWPAYRAGERARRIDASMERTVAFTYALSRSGMAFPKVMAILARNRPVYGEAAREVEVAVRDMQTFGADLVAALGRLSRRTPSENMSEFTENLESVLRSGRSLGTFLRDQYEYYREESEAQQERFLELLATLAEAYVTVLVAGPLFLITVLVVLGLVLGGTFAFLQVLVYVLIPLATAGFVVYLDSLGAASALSPDRTVGADVVGTFSDVRAAEETAGEDGTRADGGTGTGTGTGAGPGDDLGPGTGDASGTGALNRGRLAAYDRMRWLRERLRDPVGYVIRNPTAVLWVTVPAAMLYLVLGAGSEVVSWVRLALSDGTITLGTTLFPLRLVDDLVVQSLLVVLGSFALVYEYRQRRLRRIEDAMPDFLDRLASANEAGMSVVASLKRVVDSDLGALDRELVRTWADVEWGASVQTALERFERRVRTPTVTRATTLITNAMGASGDLGPVLRIAADEAQATRRLQRRRRQELVTYVVVIYIAFFVFLTIVVALSVAFLPALPAPSEFSEQLSGAGGFGGITEERRADYQLLFFHTTVVQALCSGLVAGQMGQGSLKDGAKHATVMVLIAYALFLVVG